MKAVFAGGCFWGLEDLIREIPGVLDTEVGYTGGENDDPTYEHHPGHAEAVEITYDPQKVTYRELLDFFFRYHNPTTLNRQGNDIGSSYRSAIFYGSPEERQEAEEFIARVDASGPGKTRSLRPLSHWARSIPPRDTTRIISRRTRAGIPATPYTLIAI